MQIGEMQERAIAVRRQFAAFERATYGREWTTEDLALGLMKDVGDLAEVVQRMEGKRPARSTSALADLEHEISDCLWSLLVLADKYEVDVAFAFRGTMDGIEESLRNSRAGAPQPEPKS